MKTYRVFENHLGFELLFERDESERYHRVAYRRQGGEWISYGDHRFFPDDEVDHFHLVEEVSEDDAKKRFPNLELA